MVNTQIEVGADVFPARSPLPAPSNGAFALLLDALASAAERGELIVLTRPPSEYGLSDDRFPGDRWLVAALLASVSDDLAVASLGHLQGNGASGPAGVPPLLISSRSAIRYVASSAEDPSAVAGIFETPKLRKDFSEFACLWFENRESSDLPGDLAMQEWSLRNKWSAIGQIIGELHRDGVVWEDAHADQFGYNPSVSWAYSVRGWFVWPGEMGEHMGSVYRQPTAARSAKDLLPILAALDRPADYRYLRQGYVQGRGASGMRVFDLIESGDLTGWRAALRERRSARAAELLALHIASDYELSVKGRLEALNQAGMAFSHAGLHADAAAAYQQALSWLPDVSSFSYRVTRFNCSQAQRRAGHLDAARQGLEEVLKLEAADPTSEMLGDAAKAILQALNDAS